MLAVLKRQAGFVESLNRLVFYRDVTRCGGLPQALEAALQRIGSELPVRPMRLNEDHAGRLPLAAEQMYLAWAQEGYRPWLRKIPMHAAAGSVSRQVQVDSANRGRAFRFECWGLGVSLACGATWSLPDLARVMDRWVGTECTAAALASEFSFVRASPDAIMYERGEEVEGTWQMFLSKVEQQPPGDRDWEMWGELVIAAARRPELRQLFPVASHCFVFSRCTRFPYTNDTPYVEFLGDDGYCVHAPNDFDHVLGQGNGEYAADLVVSHLPLGCGPAVIGTAEDVAKKSQE